jgi:hypothetical protein
MGTLQKLIRHKTNLMGIIWEHDGNKMPWSIDGSKRNLMGTS